MTEATTLQLLKLLNQTFAKPENWKRNSYGGRNKRPGLLGYIRPTIFCGCLVGGVRDVARQRNEFVNFNYRPEKTITKLAVALYEALPQEVIEKYARYSQTPDMFAVRLIDWNDEKTRTFEDIRGVIERALAKAYADHHAEYCTC